MDIVNELISVLSGVILLTIFCLGAIHMINGMNAITDVEWNETANRIKSPEITQFFFDFDFNNKEKAIITNDVARDCLMPVIWKK